MVADQQAGVDECVDDGLFFWIERAAADPAAGRFVVAAHGGELDQCRHHQPAVAEPVELAGHLVGAAAQGPDHAAQRGVALGRDLAGGGCPPGQFAQRVGEQRHGVSAGGVLDHPLDQARVELESGPTGRSADDLAELRSARGSMTSASSIASASPTRSGEVLRYSDRTVATAQSGLSAWSSAPRTRCRNARCSLGPLRSSRTLLPGRWPPGPSAGHAGSGPGRRVRRPPPARSGGETPADVLRRTLRAVLGEGVGEAAGNRFLIGVEPGNSGGRMTQPPGAVAGATARRGAATTSRCPTGPTIATNLPEPCRNVGCSRLVSRSISRSRPKNTAASSKENDAKPG